jgi:hypothetical protein
VNYFSVLKKPINDHKVNTRGKKMCIGSSALLKNLQTTKGQTHEERE